MNPRSDVSAVRGPWASRWVLAALALTLAGCAGARTVAGHPANPTAQDTPAPAEFTSLAPSVPMREETDGLTDQVEGHGHGHPAAPPAAEHNGHHHGHGHGGGSHDGTQTPPAAGTSPSIPRVDPDNGRTVR
jgi:hypothetical protein